MKNYKSRFEVWDKEKIQWLEKLSLKKAIRLEEGLLSSVWEWRKNFFKDNPVCLKDSLRKKI